MQGHDGFNNQLGNVLTLRPLHDNVCLLSTPILLLGPENISMGYRFLQTIVFEAKYLNILLFIFFKHVYFLEYQWYLCNLMNYYSTDLEH